MESEYYFNINEFDFIDIIPISRNLNSEQNNSQNSNSNSPILDKQSTITQEIYDYYIDDKIFSPIICKLRNKKHMMSERIKKKINEILYSLIGTEKINYKSLIKLMFEGIPDDFPGVRSVLWKLMLNYLPNSTKDWKNYLVERRLDYENIKMDFIGCEEFNTTTTKPKTVIDDIIKDIKRTRMQMHFFGSNVKQVDTNESTSDVLTRILFIFAMLHPDISYIQGMNEILAPIYYCFSSDPNEFFNKNVEADVFYCFENLMLEIKEIFLREKDNTEAGIKFRINKINVLLEFYDPELYDHFKNEKVELDYFMFRWFTLLFTQEFNMPDTLRLWDSIVVHTDKYQFLTYICIGIVSLNRDLLLKKDFSNIMHLMQNLNLIEADIEKIIHTSADVKSKLSELFISF
jgi:hypothetical protein